MHSRQGAGMFSMFDDVLDLLKRYELGHYQGVEVNLGKTGVYYQPSHGENWWSYYCEPISLGKKSNSKMIMGGDPYIISWRRHPWPRKEASRLIKKYIRIKSHIQKTVNVLSRALKDHFVISVHYRATDKLFEAPRVSFEKFEQEVLKTMKAYGQKKYKIFVATDEQAFLCYMIKKFGILVHYNPSAIRSKDGKPVHNNVQNDQYKCGEDALIDALLLSRGNYLIKTVSFLSRWATFFNINLPFVELSNK